MTHENDIKIAEGLQDISLPDDPAEAMAGWRSAVRLFAPPTPSQYPGPEVRSGFGASRTRIERRDLRCVLGEGLEQTLRKEN